MLIENQKIIRKGFGYEPPETDFWEYNDYVENFEANHKVNKRITSEILFGWDKSRNSDFLLLIEYLRIKYPIKITSSKEDILIRIPRNIIPFLENECPDCPGRIRRKLIEEAIKNNDLITFKNLIPTNPYVLEKRLRTHKIMRDFFSKYSETIKTNIYSNVCVK